jgi:glyoxylase-like metal-dependent hydrolase (beta-lactamase superfamily II)
VRAVGLHEDVVVATSRAYQTTCTLVRSPQSASRSGRIPNEAFCIDSPIFPDELEILPALAEQAGFAVVGLLATHADWDHVLGRLAFPEAPLGCAETTATRLVNEIGDPQRKLREFDGEFYVERPRPLSLPSAQSLPAPGKVDLGDRELELHPTEGHTDDGMAIWIPWARVLVVGDYLSPIEIPWLHGSIDAYLATLNGLEPLVEEADHVVPGHGAPLDGARAAAILREDRAYLEALLADGEAAKLPLARRSDQQREIHAENVARVAK